MRPSGTKWARFKSVQIVPNCIQNRPNSGQIGANWDQIGSKSAPIGFQLDPTWARAWLKKEKDSITKHIIKNQPTPKSFFTTESTTPIDIQFVNPWGAAPFQFS